MATRQRRQLQLTGFEIAMIAVSFVFTVTAVFFLGLYVGKKNASYHASAEERVARIPVDDFTSYKRPAPIEKPEKPKAPPPEEADAAAAKEAAKAKEAAAAKEAKAKEKQKAKELAKEEEAASAPRGYTVQILSTRKQGEADALVSKLKSHGYAAYIKKVSEGEGA